ncbi:universal stress protein [Arthrobacter sp. Soil762]|uniref:universal stress protein n=1 Tax=Arthrobacter sp. Soil762 TaxID=1736401 RepID=UPI0006FF4885|nr:universal stress protein [Arthrobacter sp. Soil762]KRE80408.1 universal stress protein UspA [Arthrobacter sp. Soil762]
MNTQATSPRIIVGVDGSEYSSNALRLARRVADSFDAPLEAITCIGTPDFYIASHLDLGYEKFTQQLEETAARLADEALDRAFGEDRPARLGVTVKFGSPAKVLVEESRDAQLLVIGRHGGGGFLSQAIGSVGRACAAHSHCPVLLVDQANSTESAPG